MDTKSTMTATTRNDDLLTTRRFQLHDHVWQLIEYFGECMNELVRKSTMIGALWLVVIEFVRLKKKISRGKNLFRRNYRATTNF